MTLEWIKCDGGNWCPFERVNLSHPHFTNLEGVYVIWHSGAVPATVYVGQGDVAARLLDHRRNNKILVYSRLGLFVTWAKVDRARLDGVERFLIDSLNPIESHRGPSAPPIAVNYPWA